MLILTRKVGEIIRIGDEIQIMLLKSKYPEIIRIGIEAPKHITILRNEVYEKYKEVKR